MRERVRVRERERERERVRIYTYTCPCNLFVKMHIILLLQSWHPTLESLVVRSSASLDAANRTNVTMGHYHPNITTNYGARVAMPASHPSVQAMLISILPATHPNVDTLLSNPGANPLVRMVSS